MSISLRKFSQLGPKSRSKKLADVVLRILRAPGAEARARALVDYARLCEWMQKPERALENIHGELLGKEDLHRLSEVYVLWRRDAGFGPEESFFRSIQTIVAESAGSWGAGTHLRAPSFSDLLRRKEAQSAPPKHGPEAEVLLHNLRSAHNVGSILRSSDCFGISRVHVSGYTPGPEHAGVSAAAMGAEAYVPLRRWESWRECLVDFRAQGPGLVVAIETGSESVLLGQMRWSERVLFVLGNEELGVPGPLLADCDRRVQIPMLGRKSSLNVSNAFAVVAYDIRRPPLTPS